MLNDLIPGEWRLIYRPRSEFQAGPRIPLEWVNIGYGCDLAWTASCPIRSRSNSGRMPDSRPRSRNGLDRHRGIPARFALRFRCRFRIGSPAGGCQMNNFLFRNGRCTLPQKYWHLPSLIGYGQLLLVYQWRSTSPCHKEAIVEDQGGFTRRQIGRAGWGVEATTSDCDIKLCECKSNADPAIVVNRIAVNIWPELPRPVLSIELI